jgi:predicted RNA binding protein YcfA (HicA-like mRNA interferase family)
MGGLFDGSTEAIIIYSEPGERKVISIPVHGSHSLKQGLASRVARNAGVTL